MLLKSMFKIICMKDDLNNLSYKTNNNNFWVMNTLNNINLEVKLDRLNNYILNN